MKTPISGPSSKARFVTIDAGHAGQRIDNFLISCLKGVPKSRVYRILRKGEVRVNKGRIKQDYRLQAEDIVRIPPIRLAEDNSAAPAHAVVERIERAVIHEDGRFIVLNKPSGVAVHGGSGISYGVIEALRASRPQAKFLELGHRLDRETSGCLVVAKKRSALRHFQAQLRDGQVSKIYLALLAGAWQGDTVQVDAPLRKNTLRSGERVVRVDSAGKRAVSWFEPLATAADCALVRVRLDTGRTHQIRVHAQHLGRPIAGDEKYGDKAFNDAARGRGLKRLFLHARQIAFDDEEKLIDVRAPVDATLRAVMEQYDVDE